MSIQATLTIPQEVKQINIRRIIHDLDAQVFIFQGEKVEATYSPTLAEWNWYMNGVNTKLSQIPKLSNIQIDAYNPDLHPNPGSWS
jgi:hypothetical protein